MDATKTITIECKNGAGFVIDTPQGAITVKVKLKLNKHDRFNGRTENKILLPDIEKLNVYRIDKQGQPQNKKGMHVKESKEDNQSKARKCTT